MRDLLFLLPVGGIKRLRTADLAAVSIPAVVTIEVLVNSYEKPKNTRPIRVFVTCSDTEIELKFFHARIEWVRSILPENSKRIISGKIERFASGLQMVHPDYIVSSDKIGTIPDFEPIYPLSRGISQKLMIKTVRQAHDKNQSFSEWIDRSIMKKFAWPSFNVAIKKAHNPTDMKEIEPKYG